MYSESRRLPSPRITLVLGALTLALMLPACGKKGSPLPPPSKLPQPVNDLKVEQWGKTVRLEFTYPTVTVGGLPLSGIQSVEVWEVVRPFVVQPTAPTATPTTTSEEGGEATEPSSQQPATSTSGQTSGQSESSDRPNKREQDSPRTQDSDNPPRDNHLHQSQEANGGYGQSNQGQSNQGQSNQGQSNQGQSQYPATGGNQQVGSESQQGQAEGETVTTTGPIVAPVPQPTISSSDFKANAKQIATIEGDDLTAAILGGKIILQVPTSSLGSLPAPEPGEEKPTEPSASEQTSATTGATTKSPPLELASPASTDTAVPAEPVPTTPEAKTPESANPAAASSTESKAPSTSAGSTSPDEAAKPASEGAVPESASKATTPELLQMTVEEVHFLAVRTISEDGKTSDYSRVAYLVPGTPAAAPTALTATPTESGIDLSWTLPEDVELEGVQVYRRDRDQSVFEDPLTQAAADATEYSDRTAQFDKQYTYAVTAVTRKRPLVQSDLSNQATVDYKDIYPPAAPPRLALFAEPDRVRLIWEAPGAPDVAGYRVERAGADGKFEILNKEMVKTPEYIDRNVTRGATYNYRVIALDTTGNASEPSSVESARIP